MQPPSSPSVPYDALSRLVVVAVFTFLLIGHVNAQYPQECVADGATSCCPGECGGPDRGECVPRAQLLSGFSQCQNAIVDRWSHACLCKGNFFGASCSMCRPGFTEPESNCTLRHIDEFVSVFNLSQTEFDGWAGALNRMKKTGDPLFQPRTEIPCEIRLSDGLCSVFDTFSLAHQVSLSNEEGHDMAHGGSAFPTFHRYYIWFFVQYTRRFGYDGPIPYWDFFTNTNAELDRLFSPQMMGEDGGKVTQGPFANWMVVGNTSIDPDPPAPPGGCPQRIPRPHRHGFLFRQRGQCESKLPQWQHWRETVLSQMEYDSPPYNSTSKSGFRVFLEGFVGDPRSNQPRDMHNAAHVWVGGIMRIVPLAANDPMFYLVHAFVDLLFDHWLVFRGVGHGDVEFPISGAMPNHNRFDCIGSLYPLTNHDTWFKKSTLTGLMYRASYARTSRPNQQGDEDIDAVLRLVDEPLFPLPGRPIRACVVGGGPHGMMAADLLSRSGYEVELFEAKGVLGGKAALHCSTKWLEYPMRIPCNHLLVHKLAHTLGVPMEPFRNTNPEGLLLSDCFDHPVPWRVLNPKHADFDEPTLEHLLDCYNVVTPFERRHPAELLELAFEPYRHMFAEAQREGTDAAYQHAWYEVSRKLDIYSMQDYLLDDMSYSIQAVQMIVSTLGLVDLASVSALEIFRDEVGQWWNDGITCPHNPAWSPEQRQGLPEEGVWSPIGGFGRIMENLKARIVANRVNVRYHTVVTGWTQISADPTTRAMLLHFRHHGETESGDFACDKIVSAVPLGVLKHFHTTPAASPSTRVAMAFAEYLHATKMVIRVRNRTTITQPSPAVPERFGHKGMQDGMGGQTVGPFGSIYYPTNPTTGDFGELLLYAWGQSAALLGKLSPSVRIRRIVDLLRKLHGDAAAESFESLSISELSAPFEQGIPLLKPGQFGMYAPLRWGDGFVQIIGDAVSKGFEGWLESVRSAYILMQQSHAYWISGTIPPPLDIEIPHRPTRERNERVWSSGRLVCVPEAASKPFPAWATVLLTLGAVAVVALLIWVLRHRQRPAPLGVDGAVQVASPSFFRRLMDHTAACCSALWNACKCQQGCRGCLRGRSEAHLNRVPNDMYDGGAGAGEDGDDQAGQGQVVG